MSKKVEKQAVVEEQLSSEEVEVEALVQMVKDIKKVKRAELLTKVKNKSIEVAKYSVPAILTGVAMKLHYDGKSKTDDVFIETEFIELPNNEEVVEEETGE